MGTDDKEKGVTETIAEEAKGLAVELYKDGAKPTVSAVGGTLGRIVRLALRPIGVLLQGGERLMSQVERKLGGVPEDRLLPAPPTIAAPAALHYALLGEDIEVANLREMFENLLVASMDRSTTADAHPAFVSMITQLTSDEAWILKSIQNPEDQAFPIVEARKIIDRIEGSYENKGILCTLGLDLDIGIDESRQAQYLTNLTRLGVLEIEWQEIVTGADDTYAKLERRVRARPDLEGVQLDIHQGMVEVTAFGKQFWRTCIHSRSM